MKFRDVTCPAESSFNGIWPMRYTGWIRPGPLLRPSMVSWGTWSRKTSGSTVRPGIGQVTEQSSVVFLDLVGYNYKLADYEADHQRFPHAPIWNRELPQRRRGDLGTHRTVAVVAGGLRLDGDGLSGRSRHRGQCGGLDYNASNPMALLADWPG